MSEPVVGSVSVTVTPDARDFVTRLRGQIEPGTTELGNRIGNNIGEAMARQVSENIDKIRVKLDELGASDVRIRVIVDDNGSAAATAARVQAIGAAADGSGGGLSIMGGRLLGLGALAVAASEVAIPAILAIGAAAAGAIAGIGVLAIGFHGIGEALQAHGKPATGGGGGGGGGGAASGISDQQRDLTARQATQTAQDQLTQATRSHTDAVTGLAKAQRDARSAQEDLTSARVKALQDIEDLNNAVKDNALDQQEAAIKLAQAKATLATTLAAPGAGLSQYAGQVAQARLDVAEAQQKSDELRLSGTRLATQDKAANKAGVEGSKTVKDAKTKVIDANVALSKAQANLTDSSHKLAEAQQNIADTALKNALAAQKAGIAAAGAAGGVDAFGDAMAKLNPLQKTFVNFLLTLKPLWDQISLAASGFLPGLEQGIKNALPAFKPFLAIIGNVATAMGTVFANIGASLGSPEGQKFFKFLSVELPKHILFMGHLFIDFGKIFANVFEAAAPLIHVVDKSVTTLFDNLANATKGPGLKKFFDGLIPVWHAVGQIFGSLAPLLGPIFEIVGKLVIEMGKIAGPIMKPLVQAFKDLVKAVEPQIPIFGHIIAEILPPLLRLLGTLIIDLSPFAGIIIGIIIAIKAWSIAQALLNIVLTANPIGLVIAALAALAIGLYEAYKHSETFRDIVDAVFHDIAAVATWWWQNIMKPQLEALSVLFKATGATAIWLWQNAIGPAFRGIVTVVSAEWAALKAIFSAISSGLSAVGRAASAVGGAFSSAFTTARNAMGDIVSAVASVPARISAFAGKMATAGASLISHLFSGIKNAVSNAGGFVAGIGKDIANAVVDGLNAILPHKLHIHIPIPAAPDVNLNIPLIPNIPHLATGGLTTGRQLAVVGDNKSANELILPMDSPATVKLLATALAKVPLINNGGGKYYTFNNYSQADPAAMSHELINRFAARAV